MRTRSSDAKDFSALCSSLPTELKAEIIRHVVEMEIRYSLLVQLGETRDKLGRYILSSDYNGMDKHVKLGYSRSRQNAADYMRTYLYVGGKLDHMDGLFSIIVLLSHLIHY
jgi:hypothetical protein